MYITGYVALRDHDYVRLQFLGARNGWLGCPYSVCDLRMCPSHNNNYKDFSNCGGEVFQIIAEGSIHDLVKSGQRIRLRYLGKHNTWIGCPLNTKCDHRPCPGTLLQARDFGRCGGEIFQIYARGKKNGQVIYSGDVIMLSYHGRYLAIQGQNEDDDTSTNFCPGIAPPAYFSYGICSKNVFRVYRKP